MGRQVAAKLTDEQERSFLAFLRRSADVTLIRAAGSNPDDLMATNFAPRGDWCWHYWLWNREFEWVPEISNHGDHVSISNIEAAPLIEYVRHSFDGPEPVGRLYWAKDFAAPDGLAYDSVAFGKWVDSTFAWVRKHGSAP
jgi:hypothetical protein